MPDETTAPSSADRDVIRPSSTAVTVVWSSLIFWLSSAASSDARLAVAVCSSAKYSTIFSSERAPEERSWRARSALAFAFVSFA
ncbi:hypothetical protein ACVIOG_000880 [Rhizobium leguminosarum]